MYFLIFKIYIDDDDAFVLSECFKCESVETVFFFQKLWHSRVYSLKYK